LLKKLKSKRGRAKDLFGTLPVEVRHVRTEELKEEDIVIM